MIVLDLVLPLMNGWKLRSALLRNPALASIPVIVLSSSDPEGLRADAVLSKCDNPETILATIARIVCAPR